MSDTESVWTDSDAKLLVDPAHEAELRRPEFLIAPPSSEAQLVEHFELASMNLPDAYAFVLHDVRTVGQGLVVLDDGTFFDAGLVAANPHEFRHPAWRSWLTEIDGPEYETHFGDRVALTIEEPAVFLGVPGLKSYHHWLTDALTKLAFLDERTLADLTIVVPDTVSETFLELIPFMGADPDRLVRIPQTAAVRYRHVVVLPFAASATSVHRRAIDEARRRLISRTEPWADPPPKVLITRRDASGSPRQLLNEPELIDRLLGRGYHAVEPGDMALNGQIASMISARAVVAVHGAGGANLLFTPENATVLHLQPEDSRFRAQGLISAVRQQRYAYCFGDCFSSAERGQHVEWLLDLDQVDEAEAALGSVDEPVGARESSGVESAHTEE